MKHGSALYRLACERNLEGIAARSKNGLYDTQKLAWMKTKKSYLRRQKDVLSCLEKLRSISAKMAFV